MSVTIRQRLRGEPVATPPDLVRAASPARLAHLAAAIVAAAFASARALAARVFAGAPDERPRRSLFQAWAASDFADRDVARQIWPGATRR